MIHYIHEPTNDCLYLDWIVHRVKSTPSSSIAICSSDDIVLKYRTSTESRSTSVFTASQVG